MAFSKKPESLNSLLKRYMKNIPQKTELKRGMVLHFWPKVVGKQVSKITRDLYFEKDKLVVKVENEAWRHEIHMNRFTIAKKLNEKVDSKVVKEIIVRS